MRLLASTTRNSDLFILFYLLFYFIFIALIKLQQLIRPPMPKNVQFMFRKSHPSQFRDILKDIRTRGIYSMIIDTKPQNLPALLTAVSHILTIIKCLKNIFQVSTLTLY